MNEVLARLDRLERGYRWWRTVAILGGVALMTLIATGAVEPVTKEIRTQRLVVVDGAGNERLVMEADGNDASLSVVDKANRERIAMGLFENDPYIRLFDKSGEKVKALFNVGEDGDSPRLTLYDTADRARLFLGVYAKTGPSISIRDQNKKPIFQAPAR